MKKNSTQSMFSKYSDTPVRKTKGGYKDQPLMTTYEQRYKGNSSMSKDITEPKSVPTLEEKIESRNAKREIPNDILSNRVSVEIAGHNYLLGANEDMSESRIRRIAALVNKILSESKDNNPGLTNSKVTTLALLDACERIITLQDENSNMKTELMYLQSRLSHEESKKKTNDPTPMEILADEISKKDDEE